MDAQARNQQNYSRKRPTTHNAVVATKSLQKAHTRDLRGRGVCRRGAQTTNVAVNVLLPPAVLWTSPRGAPDMSTSTTALLPPWNCWPNSSQVVRASTEPGLPHAPTPSSPEV